MIAVPWFNWRDEALVERLKLAIQRRALKVWPPRETGRIQLFAERRGIAPNN